MTFLRVKYHLQEKLCWSFCVIIKIWRRKYQNGEKYAQTGKTRLLPRIHRNWRYSEYHLNNVIGKHLLIFEKLVVVLGVMNIVACQWSGKTNMVIVKFLIGKNAQYVLKEKYILRNILLYDHNENNHNSKIRKTFINQNFVYIIVNFMVWWKI